MQQILDHLFSLQDLKYKEFHKKLIPTVDPDTIIGIRTPALRAYAKSLYGTPSASAFLCELPHRYYEENNLHGFLIERIREFDLCMEALDTFLPYVDNWATCDMLRPICFRSNRHKLLPHVLRWLKSDHVYTVRYAIEILQTYFLDENFSEAYLLLVSSVTSSEYYVNMMIAWYFATALAFQYDSAILYLQEKRLSPWVHNKTIQKAVESCRITKEQKTYLRTLRR